MRKNVEVFDGKNWKHLKDFPITLNGGPKATFIPGNDNIVYIAGGIEDAEFGFKEDENILLNTIWEFDLHTNEIKELSYTIPVGNHLSNLSIPCHT